MRDRAAVRERYLRDGLPIRLGGLAANLARVSSLSDYAAACEVVDSLLDESKFFIEWIAAEEDAEFAGELVELQVQLARWQYDLRAIWPDPVQRQSVAEQSRRWSERLLRRSGLLS